MRLTALVLRHRRLVALFWLLIAVAGILAAPRTADRLSYESQLPGRAGFEANAEIARLFDGGGEDDPLLFVVRGDGAVPTADRLGRAAREAVPGTRVVSPGDDGAAALAPDDALAVVVLYPPPVPGPDSYAVAQPRLEALADRARDDGDDVVLTGFDLLVEGGGGDDRGVLIEVLLGGLGALVVLALVFGSLLAGVPLLVAAVSILGTFLALLGLSYLTDVVFVVQYLVALIGLGVSIDYSLLVVTRWREERDAGASNDDAVRTAMATAGRSVIASGITVAVSLASLVLVPLSFLRSIGIGGLLIPLFAVATAVTLVPALLSAFGPRLSWPRRKPTPPRSRLWTRIATGVLRHRWATVIGSVVVLGALAAPVFGLALGAPQLSGLTGSSSEARALAAAVADGVPPGVTRPVEVVVDDDGAADAVRELRAVGGVAAVTRPDDGWSVDGRALLQVWLADDPGSSAGRDALAAVRATDVGAVGGSAAEDADFVVAVYDNVIWVVLAVVLLTFVLLARALRSVWLPLKALVLNAVSLAAAYGVTVLVWQEGFGSELLFGQQATGTVTVWVPIAAFAFLFGLSMDYEVFILARMREAYDEHGDTDRAVVDGIAHTGRLVTSAAFILLFAFIALATVPSVEVKILATALALGILIDALIVRGLLAPALVAVLGRANWTFPSWLARVLLVRSDRPGAHRAGAHVR